MKPFLYQVAEVFYQHHKDELTSYAFVFPNRRAGIFFQKYLVQVAGKPMFSPTIVTINDLFQKLSGKQTADRVGMLFRLYDIFIAHSGSKETFDEFLYWGEMLLSDFDDIDKYMVDAARLFSNISDLKNIDNDFDFLTEEQIAAIRKFWSTFNPERLSGNQKEFLAVWEVLLAIYSEFKESLAQDKIGYDGMIFREVVEEAKAGKEFALPYKKIVFVGLNALSTSEEQFLLYLKNRNLADFYWDYDSDKITDRNNRSSYFVDKNKLIYPSAYKIVEEPLRDQTIEVIGVPSGVGQAKYVYSLLSDIYKQDSVTSLEAMKTAVVLPDETLLMPVLHSIPDNFQRINVTMGYPLASTPIALLMENILDLQKNIRMVNGGVCFYYKYVLPVLNHRYVAASNPDLVVGIASDIVKKNRIYVTEAELDKSPLLRVLFKPIQNKEEVSDYLIHVLEELAKILVENSRKNAVAKQMEEEDSVQLSLFEEARQTSDEEELLSGREAMDGEFIFHYFTMVNRMKDVMQRYGLNIQLDTYFRLLKRMTDGISIPFRGEPLSGLQIMGVLETRALDFDNLIILSMNEGIFPVKKTANTFIPYNLRRGFGLPTYEHQDSVLAYHFYRLIYRAKHVSLVYDTRSDGMKTGEMSRYIHQLRYHYKTPIQDKLLVYNISQGDTPSITVEKNEEILKKLSVYKEGGYKSLSASSISNYIDCPLRFFFATVEGMREDEEVTERVEADRFGSILHKVLEELYKPLVGHVVTADLLHKIRKDKKEITHEIEKAFAEIFFKSDTVRPLEGENYLISQVIYKYIDKLLAKDAKLTPFTYIESEKLIQTHFPLSDGTRVRMKGFIDRVDEVNKQVRIIDYKTGKAEKTFKEIADLFDSELKDRPKAIMQVFTYALLTMDEFKGRDLAPGIYTVRQIFTDAFDPAIYQQTAPKIKHQVDSFAPYAKEFEEKLRSCLDDIFNPDINFNQTLNEKNCEYCPFKTVCNK